MPAKKTLSRKQRFFNKINITTDDAVYVGIDVHKKSDFGGASPTLLVYSLEICSCWFLEDPEAEFGDYCEDMIEDVGVYGFVGDEAFGYGYIDFSAVGGLLPVVDYDLFYFVWGKRFFSQMLLQGQAVFGFRLQSMNCEAKNAKSYRSTAPSGAPAGPERSA